MSDDNYTLGDKLWAFIGISLVIAITCALFALIMTFLLFNLSTEMSFFKPLFFWPFGILMFVQVVFPKLLASMLGGVWRLITGILSHPH